MPPNSSSTTQQIECPEALFAARVQSWPVQNTQLCSGKSWHANLKQHRSLESLLSTVNHTWMLGAKPPSSPTFVASWPYFFLMTACGQETQLKSHDENHIVKPQEPCWFPTKIKPCKIWDKSLPVIDLSDLTWSHQRKEKIFSPWGYGKPHFQSSWLPWKNLRLLAES